MINVIGLGLSKGDLTLSGVEAVKRAKYAVFKTDRTETYAAKEYVTGESETLDSYYETSDDFDEMNDRIVDRIVYLHEKYKDIAYLVGGSGFDDRTVLLLKERGEDISITAGVSQERLVLSPDTSMTVMSAYDIVNADFVMPESSIPLVVKEIDNVYVAAELKLLLGSLYGDETKITVVSGGEKKTIPLYELDSLRSYDHKTMLEIRPVGITEKERFTFGDIVRILKRLRDKENGCEWDKAQTHESIRSNLIEESYELLEAIDNKDIENMIEECGDVLLQSLFHAEIANEKGEFCVSDTLSYLGKKLVTRHTHIFGDVIANNAKEALDAWENAKAKEKSQESLAEKVDGIANSLPIVMRAEKTQKKAAKYGFDFSDINDAVKKIYEETEEFLSASDEEKETEGGDLLFAAINVLRMRGVDGELALKKSLDKFVRRIKYAEKRAAETGKDIKMLTEEELDGLWEECKANEDR